MGTPNDPVLDALEALEHALEANNTRARLIFEQIERIRGERADGKRYSEMISDGDQPIVQLVTESATALDTYGVRLRRIAAQVLYNEGLTMEQIASVFGVTRQRVSALLKQSTG